MDKCRNLPEGAWRSYSDWLQTVVAKNRRTDPIPPAERAATQQQLLAAASTSANALAAALRQALSCADGRSMEIGPLTRPLTAADVWSPRKDWETMLHESLSSPGNGPMTTRAEAAQVLFWAACSVAWLEAGSLGNRPTGLLTKQPFAPLVSADPNTLNDNQRRLLDDASRQALRGLGGIPHVRSGHNNVLLDSAMARAWWRVDIARQAESSSDGELSFDDCYEAFLPRGCWRAWTTTAMTMAGRLSPGQCAAGFAAAITKHQQRNSEWPKEKQAREIASSIVRRSAAYYPGMLDYRTLAQLAE